jgi:hypothetical protein
VLETAEVGDAEDEAESHTIDKAVDVVEEKTESQVAPAQNGVP